MKIKNEKGDCDKLKDEVFLYVLSEFSSFPLKVDFLRDTWFLTCNDLTEYDAVE